MHKRVVHATGVAQVQRIRRDALAGIVGGTTAVPTLVGVADIVTPTHVWQVRPCRQWKAAVGQALISGAALGRRPGIALFGWLPEAPVLGLIEALCGRLGVEVVLQPWASGGDPSRRRA